MPVEIDGRRVRTVDCHTHIASEEFIPRSFSEGAVRNIAAGFAARGIERSNSDLLDTYLANLQDTMCDELIAEMEEAGIDAAILLLPDFTYALPDAKLTIAEMFERHAEVRKRHQTKLAVFGGVDPRWGRDGVALFERGLDEMGFSGLKLYPPCGYSPSDPDVYPLYEVCRSRGVPVLIHIGPTSPVLSFEPARPWMVDQAARDFPDVHFILGHGGVNFPEECHMLCSHRPNVWMEISSYQRMISWPDWEGTLAAYLASGIAHKVLLGTDWPVFRMQGTQKELLGRLLGDDGPVSELSFADAACVLSRNLERVLPEVAGLGAT